MGEKNGAKDYRKNSKIDFCNHNKQWAWKTENWGHIYISAVGKKIEISEKNLATVWVEWELHSSNWMIFARVYFASFIRSIVYVMERKWWLAAEWTKA